MSCFTVCRSVTKIYVRKCVIVISKVGTSVQIYI